MSVVIFRILTCLTFASLLVAAKDSPTKRLSISEFGAVADGVTLNTEAIQRAIDAAFAAGGGVVEIPKGIFRSGSIFLKQGVELTIGEGATLLGSNDINDYPKRETRIEGQFTPWRMALVNAEKLDEVRIGGKGRIDGNGILFWAQFWQRRKENPKCTNLEVERPRLMFIDRCTNVRIDGLEFRDSGFWNLHLYRCRDVLIEGLDIHAPTKGHILGPSTDGIDVDSSQKVTIRKCRISVNDDNIALKGSKGPTADQDRDSPPVEDILIEDCEFGDGNGMVTFGSEATIIRNVTVRNCRITGSATLLTLKLRPDTPQHYHQILIDGIELSGGVGRVLNVAPWRQFFDLKGHPAPVSVVSDVIIRNVRGSFGLLGTLHGNPGDTLRDITLENFDVRLAQPGFKLGEVENFQFKNVRVNGEPHQSPASLVR